MTINTQFFLFRKRPKTMRFRPPCWQQAHCRSDMKTECLSNSTVKLLSPSRMQSSHVNETEAGMTAAFSGESQQTKELCFKSYSWHDIQWSLFLHLLKCMFTAAIWNLAIACVFLVLQALNGAAALHLMCPCTAATPFPPFLFFPIRFARGVSLH